MSKKLLYTLLLAGCFLGYGLLAFQMNQAIPDYKNQPVICLFKKVTGLPCPSCGSTRAVVDLLNGHVWDSIHHNPLGIIVFIILLMAPGWILFDLVFKKDTLHFFFKKLIAFIERKWVAIILIVLIVINWFWNYYKGI